VKLEVLAFILRQYVYNKVYNKIVFQDQVMEIEEDMNIASHDDKKKSMNKKNG